MGGRKGGQGRKRGFSFYTLHGFFPKPSAFVIGFSVFVLFFLTPTSSGNKYVTPTEILNTPERAK